MARAHLIAGALIALAGCAPSPAPKIDREFPPNVAAFGLTPLDAFRITLEVLRAEFLVPIPISDEERLYFASDLVRESVMGIPARYRISGNVVFDGQRSVVTLYRHLQILEGNEWKTRPSDLSLESRMLSRIRSRLAP